jgi:hypothetical protein
VTTSQSAIEWPVTQQAERTEAALTISVVFTSVEATLAALRKASCVAESLGASIDLIVPQVIPFPLQLTSPPVLIDFSQRRFRVTAGASSVAATVRICLCRDPLEMLKSELHLRSIVVLGIRKRWWPTRDMRLAAELRRAGYVVITPEVWPKRLSKCCQ